MARKLSDFIHDEMNSTNNGKCVQFVLVYPKEADREVHVIRLTGESATPEDLAKVFTDIAETDAQHYDAMTVVYSVRSFFQNTGAVEVHRFPVRVKGNTDFAIEGNTEPEGPTDVGERMQRMRHREDSHDAVIRMAGVTFQALGGLIHEMRSERQELRSENSDMFALLKDIIMQKAMDDHGYRMKERQYERTSMEIKKLWDTAPAALRMLGVPVPDGTADTSLLEGFVDGLTDEQSQKLVELMATFPPEKAMLMADRMAQLQEKLNREKAARKKAIERADAETTIKSPLLTREEAHANGKS